MTNETPAYYAVIPANVRYAKIPPNAKLLFWEITSLANKYWYCYASNQYFAELYDVRNEQISRWISVLEKENFITLEIDTSKWNSRKIFIGSELGGIAEKRNRSCAKTQEGIAQKRKYNNKYNNTYNKKEIKENSWNIFSGKNISLKAQEKILEFISYRKEKKSKLTERSILAIIKKAEQYGEEKTIATINTSIENGWQGLFWEKSEKSGNFFQKTARNALTENKDYSTNRFNVCSP